MWWKTLSLSVPVSLFQLNDTWDIGAGKVIQLQSPTDFRLFHFLKPQVEKVCLPLGICFFISSMKRMALGHGCSSVVLCCPEPGSQYSIHWLNWTTIESNLVADRIKLLREEKKKHIENQEGKRWDHSHRNLIIKPRLLYVMRDLCVTFCSNNEWMMFGSRLNINF